MAKGDIITGPLAQQYTQQAMQQYGIQPPAQNAGGNQIQPPAVAAFQGPGVSLNQNITSANVAGSTATGNVAATNTQNQAITQPVPSVSPPSNPINSQDLRQEYQQKWSAAKDGPSRDAIANSYKTATGNDLVTTFMQPSDLQDSVALLKQSHYIDLAKNAMQSKAVQNLTANPVTSKLASALIETGESNVAEKIFGLSDSDMQGLAAMTILQGQGDKSIVGGRLSAQMIGIFSSSQPGMGKSVGQNNKILNDTQNQIEKNLDSYAKNSGLGVSSWQDIPGLSPYASQSISKGVTKGNVSSNQGVWQ